MPHYEHLSQVEREQIALTWKHTHNLSQIGREIGRPASTVLREIQRNGTEGKYYARRAGCLAQKRRQQPRRARKIVGQTQKRVKKQLKQLWSPDQIAGRGSLEGYESLSFMSIYRYIGSPEGKFLEQYLRGPGKARRRNRKNRDRIHDRVMIDERPQEAESKLEMGHWEGDTVRGPMKSPRCVMTLVERISQYLEARLLSERKASELNKKAAPVLKKHKAKTLTVDNGMEFASHQKLQALTGTSIYFAHEKCPWERGLNEQVNGLLRQFFPKGTDFSEVSPAQLRRAVRLLNNRPRKTLGYRTPNEVIQSRSFALVK